VTSQRVCVGRDVELVAVKPDGVALEGRARLRPGRLIELVLAWPADGRAPGRRATVQSWSVVRVGSDRPTFRGFCRWDEPLGNGLPGNDAAG